MYKVPIWNRLPKPAWGAEFGEFHILDDLSKEEYDFTEYISAGDYITLLSDVSVSLGPATIGDSEDLSRVWLSYADEDGVWIARSSEDMMEWEDRLNIVSAPTGATRPSVVFDGDGNYVIYVEFLPAGAAQKEVWIVEYPYSGEGVRKLTDGQYPVGYRHPDGSLYVFYQSVSEDRILYRSKSDNYSSSHIVPLEPELISGVYPLGVKTNFEDLSPEHGWHILYKWIPILFWTNVSQEDELPWYKVAETFEYSEWITAHYIDKEEEVGVSVGMLDIEWIEIITLEKSYQEEAGVDVRLEGIEWVAVLPSVHFTILDSNENPLEDVSIAWDGQVYTTDINGQATTHSTESGVHYYDLTHEGTTYNHIIGISYGQAEDIHVTDYFLPWNTDMEEEVGVSTSLEDIEWIEIIMVESSHQEEAGVSVGLESILWVEITFFDVTFHKNGGDTEADPQVLTVEDGETVDELPTPPTRDGYTFTGWNTQSDGEGTVFDETTEVTTDITVYAQWEEDV